MNLIYITDAYGRKARINKDDLDNPARKMLPIYNRNGVKITDMRTYDPRKHSGQTHIHRANIQGTPEYEESQKAYKQTMSQDEQPIKSDELFTGTYYTVTDEAITPTGKTETYSAQNRDDAVLMALYTHRLHNGRAWATLHGVIHCPSCGQIAITSQPEQPEPTPMVDTGEGAPQYTFFAAGDKPTQLSLF